MTLVLAPTPIAVFAWIGFDPSGADSKKQVTRYDMMPCLTAGGVKNTFNAATGQLLLSCCAVMSVGESGALDVSGTGSSCATSTTTPVAPSIPLINADLEDVLFSCWMRSLACWLRGYAMVPVTTVLPGKTVNILQAPPDCSSFRLSHTCCSPSCSENVLTLIPWYRKTNRTAVGDGTGAGDDGTIRVGPSEAENTHNTLE